MLRARILKPAFHTFKLPVTSIVANALSPPSHIWVAQVESISRSTSGCNQGYRIRRDFPLRLHGRMTPCRKATTWAGMRRGNAGLRMTLRFRRLSA